MSCPMSTRLSYFRMAVFSPSCMASIKRISDLSPCCATACGLYGLQTSPISVVVSTGIDSCVLSISTASFISSVISSFIATISWPEICLFRIRYFSKLLIGSFLDHSSINSCGTYLVPLASSCPRILKVLHSNKKGLGFFLKSFAIADTSENTSKMLFPSMVLLSIP